MTKDHLHPLTLTQQDIYFDQQKYPANPLYNIGGYIRIGDIDVQTLVAAHCQLVVNDDSYGLRIVVDGDGVFQYISQSRTTALPLLDFCDQSDSQLAARQWLDQLMRTPIEVDDQELFRSFLLKLSDDDYWYVGFSHHLAMDGVGFANWAAKLDNYYRQNPVSQNNYRWTDVINADQRYIQSKRYQLDAKFWQTQCQQLPPKILQAQYVEQFDDLTLLPSKRSIMTLDGPHLAQLKQLAQQLDVGLSHLFLAVFASYFANAYHQQKLVFGVPSHNRKNAAQKQMIGVFTSVSPLVIEVERTAPFSVLVKEIAQRQRSNYRHQSYPIGHINRDLGLGGEQSSLYDVVYNYLKLDSDLQFEGQQADLVYLSHYHQQDPLMINVWEYGQSEQVQLQFDYNLAYFNDQEIDALQSRINHLLTSIGALVNSPVGRLPTMNDAELSHLYPCGDQTPAQTDCCLHHLFESQVEKTPKAIAVVYGDTQLSYQALNQQANQIASYLIEHGISLGDKVGVCVDRGTQMVVVVMAVLKAGATYVALDPKYPLQRLTFLIHDCDLSLILSQTQVIERLSLPMAKVIDIDSLSINDMAVRNPIVPGHTSQHLSHLIYTSGSTGNPKGVEIRHQNAVALIEWARQAYTDEQLQRVLASTSLNFDLSVFELFTPLSLGYQCVVVDDATALLTQDIDVTLINSVPSVLKEVVKQKAIPAQTRVINLAGEPLTQALVNDILTTSDCEVVVNCYGPSEDTTYSIVAFFTQPLEQAPGIGRPLPGTQAYVLSPSKQLVPGGGVGELFLSGAGVAQGYHKRPELTQQLFTKNPANLAFDQHNVFYQTGDLVRIGMDGQLSYLGRLDEQVKIRGFRIEPGEIEARIRHIDSIEDATVLAKDNGFGDLSLVGYIKLTALCIEDQIEEQSLLTSLSRQLAQELPAHMVPAAYVIVDEWPLTPNGKLDKKALLAMQSSQALSEYIAPATPCEQSLVEICSLLLNIEQAKLSVSANFFGLGGHSLLAVKLMVEIRAQLDKNVSLSTIFDATDIRTLAQSIDALDCCEHRQVLAATARDYDGDNDVNHHDELLSFAQQSLWLQVRMTGDNATYNMPLALDIVGDFCADTAEQAINRIVARHEVLRSVYFEQSKGPVQSIRQQAQFVLCRHDLSSLTEQQQADESAYLVRQHAANIFDLKTDLMVKAAYILLHKDSQEGVKSRAVLMFNLHHIAADGHSIGVWIKEFVAQYQAITGGHPDPFLPLQCQYADYAIWQRQWLDSASCKSQLDYWREQLENVPVLHNLPLDHPRQSAPAKTSAQLDSHLSNQVLASLEQLATGHNLTLFMLLHSALALVIARHSNMSDIVIGAPAANRTQPELAPLIGYFVNTLVLRTDTSHTDLKQYLAHVRQVNLAAQANQEVPFERLVDQCQVVRTMDHMPLVQIVLSMQANDFERLSLPQISISRRDNATTLAKFDLDIAIGRQQDGLTLCWVFNEGLFEAQTIGRLSDHLLAVLAQMAQIAPGDTAATSQISQLPKSQHHHLVHQLSGQQVSHASELLYHQLFERQVADRPNHCALVHNGESLSYGELNAQANQLAHYLRANGVGADTVVGVCMDNSLLRIVSVMAINKAGGAYLPLDPQYPVARLRYMLVDSGLTQLLMHQHLFDQINEALLGELATGGQVSVNVLDHALTQQYISQYPCTNINDVSLHPGHLAYVIYTSGSTGKPKGVMVAHRGLVNLILSMKSPLSLDADSRVLQTAAFGFDAASLDMSLAFGCGGTLHLIDKQMILSPVALAEYVRQQQINFSFMSPGLLNVLDSDKFKSIKTLAVGGEAISWDTAQLWSRTRNLFNVYGPTENTIVATFGLIEPGTEHIPIGRPIDNVQCLVLDANQQLVPFGVIGELYIGGTGVARGYLNSDALTNASFIANPVDDRQPGLWYKTGDLVKYLLDGQLNFVGRVDMQVKIRGYRIELGEIEHQLSKCDNVSSSIVLVDEQDSGQKHLLAYVCQHQVIRLTDFDSGVKLGVELRQSLPEHMIPSLFIFVNEWPMTPGGKIDKDRLPAPEATAYQQQFEAAQNDTERQLVAIIAKLSNQVADELSVSANFFDLGGDSLLAVRLVNEVRISFVIELPIQAVFEALTIKILASKIEQLIGSERRLSIVKVAREGQGFVLSFAQQRLWFIDQMDGSSVQYNIPVALEVNGDFDTDIAGQAIARIIDRHESLRTVFADAEQGPVQFIQSSVDFDFVCHDLSKKTTVEKSQIVDKLIKEDAIKPFDLACDLMLRASYLLLQQADGSNPQAGVLLFNIHHIAADGWSSSLLVNEFVTIYQAIKAGRQPALVDLTIQYADFAVWQQNFQHQQGYQRQLDYWLNQLALVAPVHSLPLNHARQVGTHPAAQVSSRVNRNFTEQLQRLASQQGVTLFVLLHSVFALMLSRHSNNKDILIGTTVANRVQANLEPLIGFFVNTLILRVDTDYVDFGDYLAHVKQVNVAAQANQDVAFEQIVDGCNISRSQLHEPLFQIMFTLVTDSLTQLSLADVSFAKFAGSQSTTLAKFDLDVNVSLDDQGIELTWVYDSSLFEQSNIERLNRHFIQLLQSVARELQTHSSSGEAVLLAQLSMQSAQENDFLLDTLNDAKNYDLPHCLMHQWFEQQVEQYPQAIALTIDESQMTYDLLNQQANQLAHYLRDKGVGHESFVGLYVKRSFNMIVAALAVLKAGGAYVPLDPEYPKGRLGHIVEDTVLAHIISYGAKAGSLDIDHPCLWIPLDNPQQLKDIQTYPKANLTPFADMTLSSLAYVIYTSGSTGKPKGVLLEHGNAVALMLWSFDYFSKEELSCMLASSSMNFDLSIFEWFVTLGSGGRVHIVSSLLSLVEPKQQQSGITYINTVPSVISSLITATGLPDSVKVVSTAGEAMKGALAIQLREHLPLSRIVQLYGPTEDTTFSSAYTLPIALKGEPPIGHLFENTKGYVLDHTGRLAPLGCIGELFLAGKGLVRGYLNQPELTAQKFTDNPYQPGERMYASGDLACYLPDGKLKIIGRIDNQVKLRGYRIELSEIEQQLTHCETVKEALVLIRDDAANPQLVAYVVPRDYQKQSSNSLSEQLREKLKQHLPVYMLPSAFVMLERWPVTANGKINKALLPQPDLSLSEQAYVAAANDVERTLVSIVAKLLNYPEGKLSTGASFFELGGHSLLAVRLVANIRQKFALELPLQKIFEYPRLFDLAREIGRCENTQLRSEVTAMTHSNEPLSLSYAQQRLWFIHRMEGASAQYNMPVTLRVSGQFDVDAAEQALTRIIYRHQSLRTVFIEHDSTPKQIILDKVSFGLTYHDLSMLSAEQQKQEVEALSRLDSLTSFDLSKDLMMRTAYVFLAQQDKFNPQKGILLFNMHHIASDGWSLGVLVKEFVAQYQACREGEPDPYPALKVQYADYAQWQRDWLRAEVLTEQLDYWQGQLSELPQVHGLTLDFARHGPEHIYADNESEHNHIAGQVTGRLPLILADKLQRLADENNMTLFMLCHGALAIVLSRHSNSDDIVIGTAVANRLQVELEPLIGFFVNTLVLRTSTNHDNLADFLAHVKQVNLDAQSHQDLPFEHLVEQCKVARSRWYSPLFQIMFSINNNDLGDLSLPGVVFSPFSQNDQQLAVKFDLDISATVDEQGIQLDWLFDTSIFTSQHVQQLSGHLIELLGSLVNQMTDNTNVSELAIADLQMFSPEQLSQYQLTSRDCAFASTKFQGIHQLFEYHAQTDGFNVEDKNNIALIIGEQQISYAQLNRQANQLAHYLSQNGIRSGDLVGLCVQSSLPMYSALLAILKVGAAYVSLDPDYPKHRLQLMLGDCGVKFLVTTQGLTDHLDVNDDCQLLLLDDEAVQAQIARQSDGNLAVATDASLAYVIYTSGSTGQPKGVMVSHQNWLAYHLATQCESEQDRQPPYLTRGKQIRDKRCVLQFSSVSFDIFVEELSLSIFSGGTLVLPENSMVPSAKAFWRTIKTNKVNTVSLPTAYWHQLCIDEQLANDALDTPLQRLIIGGEAASSEHWLRWQRCFGNNISVLNTYGPTEATVIASYYSMADYEPELGTIPIGQQLVNGVLLVLDAQQCLVPDGAIGQLYIGGPSVAVGYLNQEQLTEQQFIVNPFDSSGQERLYCTGDLVRQLPANEQGIKHLMFVGRVDNQVKISGFRIELGEIEVAVLRHLSVAQAVVVTQLMANEPRIVVYITSHKEVAGAQKDSLLASLRTDLGQQLPAYMIPSTIELLSRLPLNSNGKVDKAQLPAVKFGASQSVVPLIGEYQQQLAAIWCQHMALRQVSGDANFFELGGHSLLLVRMISDINTTFAVDLPIRAVFYHPVLADLAHFIEQLENASHYQIVPMEHDGQTDFVLSSAQQRIWTVMQMDTQQGNYNIPTALRVEGQLNIVALQGAFDEVLARHEVLRTNYFQLEDSIIQRVGEHQHVPLIINDCTHQSLEDDQMHQLLGDQCRQQIDLVNDAMVCGYVNHLADNQYLVVFVIHHIAADGWSMAIFYRELIAAYRRQSGEMIAVPKALPIQYIDYALWQFAQGQSPQGPHQSQLAYWVKQLADVPKLHSLPYDFSRGRKQDLAGVDFYREIDSDLYQRLQSLAQDKQVSLFMLLDSVLAIMLNVFSREQDIVVGTPVSGRQNAQTEQLIGCFINVLPLRHQIIAEQSFSCYLAVCKAMIVDGLANQSVSFEQVVNAIGLPRSLDHAPLVQVMFVFDNDEPLQMDIDGLTFSQTKINTTHTKYDLQLFINEQSSSLSLRWLYASSIFKAQTIERMATTFTQLLYAVVATPDERIGRLPMVNSTDLEWLESQNDSDKPYINGECVHHQFMALAASQPDAVAIIDGSRKISYSQLDKQSNQLAHDLIARGLGRGDRVAIYLDRSVELVVSMLGTLKAGLSYVPLERKNTPERLTLICQEAQVRGVLTVDALVDAFCADEIWWLAVDSGFAVDGVISALPTVAVKPKLGKVEPADSVYIIYTSGSTGVPKGVEITHIGLLDYCDFARQKFYSQQLDGALLMTSHGFDLAVPSVYLPLICGHRIDIIDPAGDLQTIAKRLELCGDDSVQFDETWLVRCTPTHVKALLGLLADKVFEHRHSFLVGGEVFDRDTALLLHQRFPNGLIFNQYGPTETVIGCTCYDVVANIEHLQQALPLGGANHNAKLYVLNEMRQRVPIGVVGELYVSGPFLAKGYVNRPQVTAEKFTANPFVDDVDSRMYQTGDWVHWLDDGNLVFVCRTDDQLKLHGYRIELGEIIEQLTKSAQVVKAHVMLREDEPGSPRLVAYVEAEQNAAAHQLQLIGQLQQQLKAALPPYMLPTAYVVVESWPTNANGKLEQKSLPTPTGLTLEADHCPAKTKTEHGLVEVWAKLLACEANEISINANFFELGGHSLLAIRMMTDIENRFGVQLQLQQIFAHSSIAQLAPVIEQHVSDEGTNNEAERLSIVPIQRQGRDLPLSFGQQRLWFINELEGASAQYNMPMVLQVSGALDVEAAQLAIGRIVERHEVLRTVYAQGVHGPVQHVRSEYDFSLSRFDLTGMNEQQQQRRVRELVEQQMNAVFNLSTDLMVRGAFIEVQEDSSQSGNEQSGLLLFDMHHIASDGWSRGLLISEFIEQYQAAAAGLPDPLAPLSIQYGDYAHWQRNTLSDEVLSKQIAYWDTQLKDIPAVHSLPLDFARPEIKLHHGKVVRGGLNQQQTEQFTQWASRHNITPFMLLHCALALVLSRHSNNHDIVLGTPVANRMEQALEPLIGFFVNTLVLRANTEQENVADLLAHIKQLNLDAQTNQDMPFEQLVERTHVMRDPSHTPLVQIVFSMNTNEVPSLVLPGLSFTPLDEQEGVVKFDLDISASIEPDGLMIEWLYDTSLFCDESIVALNDHFEQMIDSISHCVQPLETVSISALTMMSESQLQRIIERSNHDWQAIPEQSIVQLFEQNVKAHQDKTAIIFDQQRIGYAQLNQYANQLALRLLENGVQRADLVGICLPRSIEMIVATLAILKVGAAYVPVDSQMPDSRLQLIIGDCQLRLMITDMNELKRFDTLGCYTLAYGNVDAVVQQKDPVSDSLEQIGQIAQQADSLAYVNFTSGSTGLPKGVKIAQRSVVRLVKNNHFVPLNSETVMLQGAPFAFDAATFEIWGSLLNGGTLVLYPQALMDLSEWNKQIVSHQVNTIWLTAGLFEQWSMNLGDLTSLRYVLSGGDVVSPMAVRRTYDRLGQVSVINGYGPTENTTFSCCYTVPRDFDEQHPLPLGRAINGTYVYVLNEKGQLVPDGSVGTLYVGGAGVSLGYLNQSEQNTSAFSDNPFVEDDVLYNTGDLVCWVNQQLCFKGRVDGQVKLRGFRIELDEIRTALCAEEQVDDALVLLCGEGNNKHLLAYVVTHNNQLVNNKQWQQDLKLNLGEKLPNYMTPRAVIAMAQFSLTNNGKVDRNALPLPILVDENQYVAPHNDIEQLLVDIWQSLLKVDEPIGVHNNFFDLGGHSILLSQVKVQVEVQLGLSLPIVIFFKNQNINELAAVINIKLAQQVNKEQLFDASDDDVEFGEF